MTPVFESPIVKTAQNKPLEPKSQKTPKTGITEDPETAIRFTRYDETKFTPDEKKQLMDIYTDPVWPAELRAFAIQNFALVRVNDETLATLRIRLDFINEYIPLDLLKKQTKYEPISTKAGLLTKRLSYLQAINDILGEAGWQEILGDPEKTTRFNRAGLWGRPFKRLDPEAFAEFAKRETVPVGAEPGAEARIDEVIDVLNQTGIMAIAAKFANKIELFEPVNIDFFAGTCNNWTGDIKITTSEKENAMLIPLILHELGHAFEYKLSWQPEIEKIYDRYIVLLQIEPTKDSPYAASFISKDGAPQIQYFGESFAEDFRLYWLKPADLSPAKREIFDTFCDKLIPELDKEEIRKKIRSVLGNYYGVSVNDVFRKINCGNAEEMATRREKKNKETKKS
jgi:hypothetical protein